MRKSGQIVRAVSRYLVPACAIGLAVLGRWMLIPFLGTHLPFSTMYPAVAVAVWYGGWLPTTLATLLGYVALDWFCVPPFHTMGITDALQLHELATFCASGAIIILFGELMRRARGRADLAKEELAMANRDLEARVQERTLKLQEALADLETFSYSIAHDMRAPLRSMTSFADIVRTGWEDKLDSEARDYLQRISKSARRLDALIVDVLNYSQVIQEKWPLQSVDTDALIREIVKSYPGFQPPAAVVTVQGQIPAVLANVGGLTQCVSNLIENGIKFAKPGLRSEITIRAELSAGRVRIWFEDNGIGIAPQWHRKVFDMFQQYHPAGKYEGTGIGLTIVRKAVERMAGRVGVESELGKGSRFWIELQAAER
jgi:signal transduction histidine kinase